MEPTGYEYFEILRCISNNCRGASEKLGQLKICQQVWYCHQILPGGKFSAEATFIAQVWLTEFTTLSKFKLSKQVLFNLTGMENIIRSA